MREKQNKLRVKQNELRGKKNILHLKKNTRLEKRLFLLKASKKEHLFTAISYFCSFFLAFNKVRSFSLVFTFRFPRF